jgi:hypothetical protein
MSLFETVNLDDAIVPAKDWQISGGSKRNYGNKKVEVPPVGELAQEFLDMLDKWHGHREIWDDALDAQILRANLEIITTNKKRLDWGKKGTKYFSPSSANSDKRELFHKITGAKRDDQKEQPHRGRWRRLGTAIGDVIQRDLLFIEKHWNNEFKDEYAPFVPEYVSVGDKKYPAWEKFAQLIKWVDYRGHKLPILGQPDGILVHQATGKRVGLEIKSKQTTAAQTGFYSMKEAKEDHFKQAVLYSVMYGVDDYIILYVNASKKAWYMTEEEYAKNPDVRAFQFHITEEDRKQLLDYLAEVLDAVDTGYPPKLDLDKWTFNNFKTATALSLSEDELDEVRGTVEQIKLSRLSDRQKSAFTEALEFIEETRAAKK